MVTYNTDKDHQRGERDPVPGTKVWKDILLRDLSTKYITGET